jgi:hypothetical protein
MRCAGAPWEALKRELETDTKTSKTKAEFASCQTGGKLLADRALSQLLKKDWPRTVEDLERRRSGD